MALIECKDVSKNYGSTVSLKQVNLSLEAGRIVGLLGPNGSGKTTLIKLLEHLLVPTSGLIILNELAPGAKTKSFVSYLPDRDFLPDWMKVNDLIKMYKDFYEDFDEKIAREMLRLREKCWRTYISIVRKPSKSFLKVIVKKFSLFSQ